MERDAQPTVACFYAEGPLEIGATVALGERVAHHAHVRRVEGGDAVAVTNGAGSIGRGRIARLSKQDLEISIERVERIVAPSELRLCAPSADRDRMLWTAEKAAELAVTTWQSVRFRRSASVSPRGEGPAFAEKLRARMIGALEQSFGAWLPRMLPETIPSRVDAGASAKFVLDVAGEPLVGSLSARESSAAVLVGPEGGIEPDELAGLVADGWRPVSLGASTLRFETAAIAAVAIVRAVQAGHPLVGAPHSAQ